MFRLIWECNQDNEADFNNRCHEVKGEHLLVKIKKESIRRLMDACDCEAALLLAEDIADFIPENTMRTGSIRAAECRFQLDQRGYAKAMQGIDHKFQPIEMGDQRQLFEYVLSLQDLEDPGRGIIRIFCADLTPSRTGLV